MSTDSAARILDAVLPSRHGIGGVSMRSAAREAGVALGLVHHHFDDKTSLICAALRRIEDQDVTLVEPDPSLPPEERLRVAAPEFLTTEYLSLRLQLWSLAQAGEEFERINTAAENRYRAGLAQWIRAARPELSRHECAKRAADVDVIQNGMWLTALLGPDRASLRRAISLCEDIALS